MGVVVGGVAWRDGGQKILKYILYFKIAITKKVV